MLPFCLQYVLLLTPEAVLVLGSQLVLAMKGTLSSSAWETDFTFSTSFIFVYLTVYVCLCACVCVCVWYRAEWFFDISDAGT